MMQTASYSLHLITAGAYGLNAALIGAGQDATSAGAGQLRVSELTMSHWLIAMPLWIIGAAIAVAVVSYRHQE